jgi:hypothetical protein
VQISCSNLALFLRMLEICCEHLNPRVKISRNDLFGFRPLLVAMAFVNESASKARTTLDQIKSETLEWQMTDTPKGRRDTVRKI